MSLLLYALLALILAHATALNDGYPSRTAAGSSSSYQLFTNAEATPITVGQAVYLFGAGTVKLAVNNGTEAQATVIGIVASTSIAAGVSGRITVKTYHRISGLSGLTADAPVFLGSTAGALTSTAPATGFLTHVGIADTTTSFMFLPRQPFGL